MLGKEEWVEFIISVIAKDCESIILLNYTIVFSSPRCTVMPNSVRNHACQVIIIFCIIQQYSLIVADDRSFYHINILL